MDLAVPGAAAALVALPAIVLLYFLKIRRPEARISSLLFWGDHVADRQANAPWQRLRSSLLLLIQLVVAALLALALMRPGVPGSLDVATTTVVLIDGSPSMQATDVRPSRFEAAVAQARRMSRDLGTGRQMAVVVLGRQAQQLTPPTSDAAVLDAALDRARPSSQRADLAQGISLANAALAGRPGGSVVLLSDGGLQLEQPAERLRAPLTFRQIGVTGDNVAVDTLVRKPDGNVAIRLVNLGPERREVEVQLLADGRLVDVVPFRLDGEASAEALWPGLAPGTGVLEARLAAADAFSLDDRAWLLADPGVRRRVVLVTGGNGFLERALELRADLDVTVVDPAGYRPDRYDLHVFDGFVPPGQLPQPAILVAPPEGAGPIPSGPPVDPGAVLPPDPRDPLLRYVNLRDVHVQAAAPIAQPPDWRTVIAAANGPLLLVHQGEPRLALLTFDLHRSDLPLRPAFPILIQNLVADLLPGGSADQVLPLGEPVPIDADPEVSEVEVTGPDGTRWQFGPPFPATLRDTTRPGVYQVRARSAGGVRTSRFAVEPDVPGVSRIAPGPAPEVQSDSPRPGQPQRGTSELWPWLAAAVLVGLGVEWVVFLRR